MSKKKRGYVQMRNAVIKMLLWLVNSGVKVKKMYLVSRDGIPEAVFNDHGAAQRAANTRRNGARVRGTEIVPVTVSPIEVVYGEPVVLNYETEGVGE